MIATVTRITLLLMTLCTSMAMAAVDYPSTGSIRIRRKTPRPLRKNLELVPTFHSCSYYWSNLPQQPHDLKVRFKKNGGPWQDAYDPIWVPQENMVRGSIVNLEENTHYVVQIKQGDTIRAEQACKTWNSHVKVGKTILLNQNNFHGSLEITSQGKPDAWIRYTAAPGFVLRNNHQTPLLKLKGAAYIILDKMTLDGGAHNAVEMRNCQHIRMTNCDISGWGSVGTQRFDKDGKFYFDKPDASGRFRCVNYSAGIVLQGGSHLVIERCYLHDPRNHANAWRYSHPAGPCGIFVICPTSTVIRYNDFIGSDSHRWNDAIEGLYNFHEDGGFNRDADIYGNFFVYCNDDNVEIDGGQQNVRVFRNRFEGSFCGLSIQGNMAGPSYVFDNVFFQMADQFGDAGQYIKTSTPGSGLAARTFIFNNSFYGSGWSGIAINKRFPLTIINNILQGVIIRNRENIQPSRSLCDYNLVSQKACGTDPHGLHGNPRYTNPEQAVLTLAPDSPAKGRGMALTNFTHEGPVDLGAFHNSRTRQLPERPIPIVTHLGRLNFTMKDGALEAQTMTMTAGGKDLESNWRIAVNHSEAPWLHVTPASGSIKSGETITLTIQPNVGKLPHRTTCRGAFLVRLDNGFSRPVSVIVKTDFRQESRLHAQGDVACYLNPATPDGEPNLRTYDSQEADNGQAVSLSKRKTPYAYSFSVPKTGNYTVMIRCRKGKGSFRTLAAIDDAPLKEAALSLTNRWQWNILAPGGGWSLKVKCYHLTKGTHVLRLNPVNQLELDLMVITDNPKAFEPR